MRKWLVLLLLACPAFAQRKLPPRVPVRAESMEGIVKQAMEQLGNDRKVYERDIEVLRHLRLAGDALADSMQPHNALQKAYDEVIEAKRLNPELTVMQGVLKLQAELEAALRSVANADFGRIRSMLRDEALRPASRIVVRNASKLEDELQVWLRVQQLIADHAKNLSEVSSLSLRAAEP
jgi:hypothetical protein